MKRTIAVGVASLTILGACGGSDGSTVQPTEPGTAEATVDTDTAVDTPAPTDGETEPGPSTDTGPDTGSGSDAADSDAASADQMFPDVIDAEMVADGDTWTVSATLSSPYDTPERYADAWRVLGPDGIVYGERVLTHDHASEQPFTRSESGIMIPDDVSRVTIEGRDLQFGYGGDTVTIAVPR